MPAPVTFLQSYLIRTEAELAELHVGLHSKFIRNVRTQIKYKTMPTVNCQLITVKRRRHKFTQTKMRHDADTTQCSTTAPCHIRAVIGLSHCVSPLLTSNVMTSLVRAVRVVGRKKCHNFLKLVSLMSFSALLYLSR